MRSIRKFANVAMPATAATVVVPDSVPPPGLVPIAMVTLPVKPVAVLPWASRAVTTTAGLMATTATSFVGCAVKTSALGPAGVTLKGVLGPVPVTPPAVAVSVFPEQRVSAEGSADAGDTQFQPAVSDTQLKELETYLASQPRVPLVAPSDGAAVVIVKFNDYQCPGCGQTQWIIGRMVAECAFCGTALPLQAGGNFGVGLIRRHGRGFEAPAAC